VLRAFPYGVLNVHPSLLPRYRGAAPAEWQILRRERFGGVSVIQASDSIDAGVLVGATKFEITPTMTRTQLLHQASMRGVELVDDILNDLPNRLALAVVQDGSLATRAPKVSRAMTVVDWNTWTVEEFFCRLNALGSRFDGLLMSPTIKVTQARPIPPVNPNRRFNKKENYIAAQLTDGWIAMHQFSVAGSVVMDAQALWNGYRDQVLAATKSDQ
jgi:methionyl-tRNA formyltransferase